ncbi:MAG: hypothetical protein BJ554DRAFT_5091 [Olpidium bornovanus]|uniref:Uncharacterized protein n=1 Tax=Olpidium bornovanus TaxID=278681 RepID=A0A8H8DEG5_9FUNG|nr:MAG: hypothetical protein BJ554DRAFT_5091 [Olpidium bornovanus]
MPQMEYRYLGKTGLKVSVISLGGWPQAEGHYKCRGHGIHAHTFFFCRLGPKSFYNRCTPMASPKSVSIGPGGEPLFLCLPSTISRRTDNQNGARF